MGDGVEAPATAFAQQLRELRRTVGDPSFRKMAERSGAISHTTLHEAAVGARFPSWATTREFVRLCGGDEAEWRDRWERARPVSGRPWDAVRAEFTGPAEHPVAQVGAVPAGSPSVGSAVSTVPPSARSWRPRYLWTSGAVLAVAVIVAVTARLNGGDAPVSLLPAATPSATVSSGDAVKFIADITVPDGSTVRVNQHFVKIWQLRNVGSVPWIGRQMERADLPADTGACRTPSRIPIPDTQPGSDVLIKVRVVASAVPERCWVAWKTIDAQGHLPFPGRRPIYFTVNVVK